MTQGKKILLYIIGSLIVIGILFLSGFIVGKKSINPTTVTVTEYIEKPPIKDTFYTPKPVYIILPVDTLDIIKQCIADGIYDELFPKKDSLIYITKDDTTAIMSDWATKRIYSETLFDTDTTGKCTVDLEVQYNRARVMSYEYIPKVQVTNTTVVKEPKFEPFIGVGLNTGNMVNGIVGGYFNNHYGVAYQPTYLINNKSWIHGISVIYKF